MKFNKNAYRYNQNLGDVQRYLVSPVSSLRKVVFHGFNKVGMSQPANIINLSSGRILFNDPSETPPWDPASLGSNPPVFPSTALAIGVQGTVDSRNIESITFTNVFQYQPYENSTTLTTLQKSLVINPRGLVTYEDPKVGVVSTVSATFRTPISTFVNSTIGGINIYDTPSGRPDTITNALGKIDGWIANAFLLQPPAVTPVQSDYTSLYGGIRWVNPTVYNVLDKSVPFVSGILFIIGTPGSGNVFSFELTDCSFFPYKSFQNGISPYGNPLVRLRIFTDFFPQTASELYSRAVMLTKSVTILEESGNATLPTTGKVFAVDYTDRQSTYTTISVYLPNLANSYPKNTPVPVQIAYINKTEGTVNMAYTSTVTNTVGPPSIPTRMSAISTTVNSLIVQMKRPDLADSIALISTPYFSTYSVEYTAKRLAIAHAGDIGFRYGIATPANIPIDFVNYTTPTTQDFSYILSTQTLNVDGQTTPNPIIPAFVWSTVGYVTNSAMLVGPAINGPIMSTLFPVNIITPIQSTVVQNLSIDQTRFRTASTLKYLSYQSGWNTGYNVSTDVFYLSTPTYLSFQLSTAVQLNDASFPGDRSTITFLTEYTNTSRISCITTTLQASTFQNDFPLNTFLSTFTPTGDILGVTIQDPYADIAYQKHFYSAQVEGQLYVSTISTCPQSLRIFEKNNRIVSFNTAIQTNNIRSTARYFFATEPAYSPSTQDILYDNKCLSTVYVSGLLTPSLTSQFQFDIIANDFAYMYGANRFADAYITQNIGGYDVPMGPTTSLSTGVFIYNNDTNTEITTLPFPISTLLSISSCSVSLYSTLYQNPVDPGEIKLNATVIPANPQGEVSTFVSTLTTSVFFDTVSVANYSTFSDINNANGIRILSLLPRSGIGAVPNDIKDSIDINGTYGIGLNVNYDPAFNISTNSNIFLSTPIIYQHASSISTFFTDYYNRELIYTNGSYIHPAGLDFSGFNGTSLGQPDAVYPNFTTDLMTDVNNGFRYATFAFQSQQYAEPTEFQYLNVLVKNPNIVSTVSNNFYQNTWFPNAPTLSYKMSTLQVRIHAKIYSAYTDFKYQVASTIWYDCLQLGNDDVYDDVPACVAVSTIGNDVQYKVQIDRRSYTRLCSVVRVGLSHNSGVYAGSDPYPVKFDAIQTSYSDV